MTVWVPQIRMTSSPTPELVAAPTSLSTNNPAPMIGESPTRPRILNARPLVVTIPDNLPFVSIATVPIVSWFADPSSKKYGADIARLFSMLASGLYFDFSSHFFHSFSASGDSAPLSSGNPFATANFCAPSPESRTCGVVSITLRATETGCLIRSRNETAPISPLPSMMHESSVTRPSRSGHAERPTQQLGSPSDVRPAASTASRARPPFLKISHEALFAVMPLSQVETTIGL